MTRILVVGAGATGGYYGAQLHRAGRDVTFLLRPGRAAAVRAGGLVVETGDGTERLEPPVVTAAELTGHYDLVLLAVKAAGLPSAVDDLAPAVGPGTAVVPFLNGMAHLDTLNERFGPAAVMGGVVMIGAFLGPDGRIVRRGSPATMLIGEQNGADSDRLRAAAQALDVAGFTFATSPDVLAAMWNKWVFISTLVAVTCLMRGTIGEVAAVPGGTRFATAVLDEAAAVAAAAGSPVPPQDYERTARAATAEGSPSAPSLYRDMARGLPTEVEHILGDLTARARTLGVATPLLDLATAHLRVHQNRAAR